jgi:4-hydroxybenzoate polyprenyltransferase
VAGRLGLAMFGLQASIGALNDVVDAETDAGHKPGKPIPRGVVTAAEAMVLAAGGLIVAVALAVPSGPATVAVAGGCLALGYLYDLRLSRTAWSWLPLAAALPLLPVFAWLGATGGVPPALLFLIPAGLVVGGGLGLANGIADLERDMATGVRTAAVRLGRRAWAADAAAMAAGLAVAWLIAPGSPTLRLGGLGLGSLLVIGGLGLSRARSAQRRERGWELQAAGVGVVALVWVAGIAAG